MVDSHNDNYNNLSIEELKEKLSAIDRELQPDKAALLEALIKEKAANSTGVSSNIAGVDENLASLGERFGAAIIDGLIGVITIIPFIMYFGIESFQEPTIELYVMNFVYGIVMLLIIHGYTMHYYAQSIGKRMMNIRIETLDSQPATLSTILYKRIIPTALVSQLVPLFALVDVAFIFRKDKRCIHDMIAGTKVTRVE